MKRSNIVTIALSRLPPPRHLPPAIYSMDSSVLDREDVQVRPQHNFIILVSVSTVRRKFHVHWAVAYLHFCPNQKLQALVPTEEEFSLIKEAKAQNPCSPLAPAEQCLLILGEIPHLITRLQLWAFTLDYDSLERVRSTLPIFFFCYVCQCRIARSACSAERDKTFLFKPQLKRELQRKITNRITPKCTHFNERKQY